MGSVDDFGAKSRQEGGGEMYPIMCKEYFYSLVMETGFYSNAGTVVGFLMKLCYYENTSIQIYRKFHFQN